MNEFSGKNVDLETTVKSSFFTNYRYHPWIQLNLSSAKGPQDRQAETLVKTLGELQDIL